MSVTSNVLGAERDHVQTTKDRHENMSLQVDTINKK
jgi:hypothetical protein